MPLFYIYSQMLTDSSAEASALGSGPRGRRFKSALSERGHRLCWCTTQSRKEACFAPEMTIFRCFFVMYVQLIAEIPLTKTKVHQTGRQPRQDLQNDRNIRLFIRDPLSFLVLVSNRTGNFYYYCMKRIR